MIKYFLLIFILSLTIGRKELIAQETQNYFMKTWEAKNFPVPEQTIPLTLDEGTLFDSIKIFPLDTIAPFLPTQLGLNTTFRSGSDMVNKRLDNYRNSNMGAFRFPAGSGSNKYFWDGNIPDDFLIEINPINATQSSALKIHEFVNFIDSLDVEATIVVNYFYARYGETSEGTREARVNQAAEYAAGFVNYVNNVLNADIKNWEIGNECYGKWEEGYDVNGSIVTGKEYGEDLRIFAEKMKAVDSSIKIGAVMYPKSDDWNNQVMKEVKNHADFLVVHNYFTAEKDATIENILASTVQINEIKEQMETCVAENTNYQKDYFPVAMTEYNCRGPHTTTFVNACFTADILGRMMESKYGMATRWVGEWKWKVGTHGLFAVSDPDQKDYSVRQAYWVYKFFGEAFGDYLIKSSINNDETIVYASKFSDGKIGLTVINPTSIEQEFNLKLPDDSTGKVWLYEIYANTIAETDKKFYVNGETSTTAGGGPDDIESIIPYEADYNTNSIFKVKKYSVSFFVFDSSKGSTSIYSPVQKSDLKVYPVPATYELNFSGNHDFESVKIFSSEGSLVLASEYKNPLDISNIPSGIYFLNLMHGSAIITKSFVKTN